MAAATRPHGDACCRHRILCKRPQQHVTLGRRKAEVLLIASPWFARVLVRCTLALLLVLGCARLTTPSLWREVAPTPDHAHLVGIVVSSRGGRPLHGASVRLSSAGGPVVDSALTDASGAFAVSVSQDGEYELRIVAIAHQQRRRTAQLRVGHVDTLRIDLRYDTTALISDCIGRDGGFGQQHCRK